jgi:hypothetical protein
VHIYQNSDNRAGWLVKTDSDGNVEWSKIYGKYAINALMYTREGGFAMTGERAILIVTNSSGNVEFTRINDFHTDEDNPWFMDTYSITETTPLCFSMVGIENQRFTKNQLALVRLKLAVDTNPPAITLLSPEDSVSYSNNTVIPLIFSMKENVTWIAYNLDNQGNVTIFGNTTLPPLSVGTHTLQVYASNNTASILTQLFSQKVRFEIKVAESMPPNALNQYQAPTADQYFADYLAGASEFETIFGIFITSMAIVAVIALALVIVYKKTRAPKQRTMVR